MNNTYEQTLQRLEDFHIEPPIFTQAVGDVLEYDPSAGASNPVSVQYPGLDEAIPGLEYVTVSIHGSRWSSSTTLPPADALKPCTVRGYARSAALEESDNYKIKAVVNFKLVGEECTIRYESLDRVYKLIAKKP